MFVAVQSVQPLKRRKGRPAKTPEPAMIQSVSTPQSTQSQRSERATRRNTRSSQARAVLDNSSDMSSLGEFSSALDVMEASYSIVSNDRVTTTPSNEAVDDTTIDETEPKERSSPSLDQSEMDIIEETLLQSQIAEEMELGSQEPTNGQQEETAELASAAPTYQNIKERLLSLIKDLGDAALSRNEGYEMEDIFMDAKVQLFGAVKRGKGLADD